MLAFENDISGLLEKMFNFEQVFRVVRFVEVQLF